MSSTISPAQWAALTPPERAGIWSAAELLPQTGPMCLLNEVIEISDTGAVSGALIPESGLLVDKGFFAPEGMIEIMAQTVGLFAGARSRAAGDPVRPGLLLGTRRLTLPQSPVPAGSKLITTAQEVFSDADGLWQFSCIVSLDEKPIAEAVLTLYAPAADYFNPYKQS